MKKYLFLIMLCAVAKVADAGEYVYNYGATGFGFYGYSDYADSYSSRYKHYHTPVAAEISGSVGYRFDNDDELSFNLDTQVAGGKEIEDYNHGKWGENLYASYNSERYGDFTVGQVYNAAYQMAVGAPMVGIWRVNNSPVTDFIANPNWQRHSRTASYRTLNSTYLNTDADAPKVSYTLPELNNTKIAFSYTPDSYSQAGLINKRSRYDNRSSYSVGLYHDLNLQYIEIESSLGYAYNHKNNQEASVGLSLYRKGWTLGGSYRQSWRSSHDFALNDRSSDLSYMPEYFDGYREGHAFNLGISYEIGPFKTGISYFASYADKTDNKDKIVSWTNRFALNKYAALYLIGAHAEYRGNGNIDDNSRGYAAICGLELSF
ncbi:MAG: hypothetical protein IJS88_06015 [Alphaproteobacteria bacterium]|nr:hypothetical protein [Alphaproteobacteria bacterium]